MKDINDIMPKIPNMRWGALMNKAPTNNITVLLHALEHSVLFVNLSHLIADSSSPIKADSYMNS